MISSGWSDYLGHIADQRCVDRLWIRRIFGGCGLTPDQR